jgi:hypothetical protein
VGFGGRCGPWQVFGLGVVVVVGHRRRLWSVGWLVDPGGAAVRSLVGAVVTVGRRSTFVDVPRRCHLPCQIVSAHKIWGGCSPGLFVTVGRTWHRLLPCHVVVTTSRQYGVVLVEPLGAGDVASPPRCRRG